ncbi:MAG: glutamate-ammonia-ligase adenylyltransferase [Planctomycetota bacterium]|jgi:glutamate-ammonia-ligase adenylyltransferase
MNIKTKIIKYLEENRFLWQNIADYCDRTNIAADDIEKLKLLVFASHYAMHWLSKSTDQIKTLLKLQEFTLEREFFAPDEVDAEAHKQSKQELRCYRHRKLIEIIYLDVVLRKPQESILRHLSDLADQLIVTALRLCNQQLAKKHGQPIDAKGEPLELNIIAMGKLGGHELNFSSDIDLICSYANEGELEGYGHLSYQEYFSRLVKLLARELSDSTENGFVYRVDLRLRPWGESGPVCLSHSALEHYYQLHAREWEQYAMVKARLLSGSAQDKEFLASMLRSFVFRKYHDHRVFEGLASLKDKIDLQASSQAMQDNIKIGSGGIREIEFFVQAFQILKGGRNHQLQSSQILTCMDVLEAQQVIDGNTIQPLRQAYLFLRKLENRIQMLDDQQLHQLPKDEATQQRIALTMDYDNWSELCNQLQQHRQQVSHHFELLFERDKSAAATITVGDGFAEEGNGNEQLSFIRASGVSEYEKIDARLTAFFASKAWGYMSARAKQRFSSLLPGLLKAINSSVQQLELFERLIKLFASIAGRSVYFELLNQNQALLLKLVRLFDQSAWIAQEVSQYPMLLENLIQTGDRSHFDRRVLQDRLQLQLDNVRGDAELELDTLRLFKREQTLLIAGAELSQEINAGKASELLSDLAEVMLQLVYQLSSELLHQQFGRPQCSDENGQQEPGFAIVGYGKLGGREMHYRSDLDVIFLHNSQGKNQQTDGKKSIENSVYFSRLAQKIISLTSILTASGKLYEIDSRLRPDGSSGLLVSSVQAYQQYQLEKAWTWEHQALVRARVVAGDGSLEADFTRIRAMVLSRPRDNSQLQTDIVEMRNRIFQNHKPPEAEHKRLKHSHGGIIDIEFMVQYWVLANANSVGSLCSYSDNISLLNELFRLHLISSSQSQLIEIYQTYHCLLHESVLQNRDDEIGSDVISAEVTYVTTCWNENFSLQEK